MSYHGEATKPHFSGSTYLLEIQIHNKISKTTGELSETELSAMFPKSAQAANMTKNQKINIIILQKFLKGTFFTDFKILLDKRTHSIHLPQRE